MIIIWDTKFLSGYDLQVYVIAIIVYLLLLKIVDPCANERYIESVIKTVYKFNL